MTESTRFAAWELSARRRWKWAPIGYHGDWTEGDALGRIIGELVALQSRKGWLPPDDLEQLAAELRVPLHRLESVSTFYTHFRREEPNGKTLDVCRDLSCRLAGGVKSTESLREWALGRDDIEIREVSCLGRCDRAPAAVNGDRLLDAADAPSIGRAVATGSTEPEERETREWPTADPYCEDGVDPYAVVRHAVTLPAARVMQALEASGLRGMGGAGFPTARKWSLVAAETATPKHVICNADESEPGSFKDRELLHDLPHLVIEGMLLAAYCVGAERGTIFIRHEYEPERRRLEAAIAEARRIGVLGENLFGSDFRFDLEIFVSPGGYVLGEETALLECIEDRRGEPRNKPPFPGNVGLFGQPTVINNVETLVHAVGITHWGAEWWRSLGVGDFAGHKFISTSGDVERPGVELFAVGTRIRDLLDVHGGMKGGVEVVAVAPGGASSNFLGPEALDLPLDFDALSAAGSMLGSGAVVFVGPNHSLLDVGLSITRFFRNESCGKCVPCRVGTEKAVELVEKSRTISSEDESLLRSLDDTMKQTSICGLGQVALGPLLSILDRFPREIRRDADDPPRRET